MQYISTEFEFVAALLFHVDPDDEARLRQRKRPVRVKKSGPQKMKRFSKLFEKARKCGLCFFVEDNHGTQHVIESKEDLGYLVWKGMCVYTGAPLNTPVSWTGIDVRITNAVYRNDDMRDTWKELSEENLRQKMKQSLYDIILCAQKGKKWIGMNILSPMISQFGWKCGIKKIGGRLS